MYTDDCDTSQMYQINEVRPLQPFWHKGFWYPHQAPRGIKMDPPSISRMTNATKPETLGGVNPI